MPNLTADPEEIHRKATAVGTSSAAMEDILRTLNGQMSDLATTWTGQGSEAFHELFATWTKNANQIKAILDQVGSSLSAAGVSYSELEQTLAKRFSSGAASF